MLENNKTNNFVSIIVSLITNVFFALGYCLKFLLPPLVILVKIIFALLRLIDLRDYKEKRLDDINANLEKQNALLKEQIKQMQSDSDNRS
ncbi:hypothetical protein IO43_11175 [Gallibacterium anatis 7990]|uniref:hypothetical protein n=1 Tax=Gallibacterium anatis TaxID=750 RepID=UPI000531C69A|nr:hypothetical protein [Gallibacterium anatis]KGQ61142.1 hypothetical protein IO43_11175 [Gallibacterium anatis 7990]